MQHFSKMVEFAKVGQPKMGLHNIGASGTAVTKDGKVTGKVIGGGGQDKPTYRTLGGNIYKIENGKSTKIQSGSIEEKAVVNAMHDPQWQFAEEVEQLELIQKHTRFLKGETKGKKQPPPEQGGYKTADDVKAAYSEGTIKKEEALKILREQFGMK